MDLCRKYTNNYDNITYNFCKNSVSWEVHYGLD